MTRMANGLNECVHARGNPNLLKELLAFIDPGRCTDYRAAIQAAYTLREARQRLAPDPTSMAGRSEFPRTVQGMKEGTSRHWTH